MKKSKESKNDFFNGLVNSLQEGIESMRKDTENFTNLTEREKTLALLLARVILDAEGEIDPKTNDIDINKRLWPIRSSLHREIMKELEECGIRI